MIFKLSEVRSRGDDEECARTSFSARLLAFSRRARRNKSRNAFNLNTSAEEFDAAAVPRTSPGACRPRERAQQTK